MAGAFAWGMVSGQGPVPKQAVYPLLKAPPPSHCTQQLDLRVDGRGYRLFRALPVTVPATAVLWMLDGNASFARMPTALLAQHPGLAVIFVGYPVETEIAGDERTLDYTPPLPPGWIEPRARGRPTGGDAAFRGRLTGALRQTGEDGLAIPHSHRTLWGHSFGGLFTLGTLFADPQAFGRYIAISPSTPFGGGLLAQAEADARPAKAKVLIMAGNREGGPSVPVAAPPGTKAMAERLARRAGLDVTWHVMRGMTHGETLHGSFAQSLDFAANGPDRG